MTEWMASINLSQRENWNYELKTQPRLKGKSTKVVITEYDLPNKYIQHHVVRLDVFIRQVVFGDDHLGGLALEPRLGLELVIPVLTLAQVDAGHPFGHLRESGAPVWISHEI